LIGLVAGLAVPQATGGWIRVISASESATEQRLLFAGASIPLTPWSKFPLPPPLPLHFPSLPLPLEVGPLIAARGLGSALAPPAGLGGARPPNGISG